MKTEVFFVEQTLCYNCTKYYCLTDKKLDINLKNYNSGPLITNVHLTTIVHFHTMVYHENCVLLQT